jgi:hypothetical protein
LPNKLLLLSSFLASPNKLPPVFPNKLPCCGLLSPNKLVVLFGLSKSPNNPPVNPFSFAPKRLLRGLLDSDESDSDSFSDSFFNFLLFFSSDDDSFSLDSVFSLFFPNNFVSIF